MYLFTWSPLRYNWQRLPYLVHLSAQGWPVPHDWPSQSEFGKATDFSCSGKVSSRLASGTQDLSSLRVPIPLGETRAKTVHASAAVNRLTRSSTRENRDGVREQIRFPDVALDEPYSFPCTK
jgi:hypothetical protein